MIGDGWKTRTGATLAFMVRDLALTLKAGPDTTAQAVKLVRDALAPAGRGIRSGMTPNIRNANAIADRYGARAGRLAAQLAGGGLTPASFAREMSRLIARAHTEQFMNGVGSRRLTNAQRGEIERQVARQLEFLNGFQRSIGETRATLQSPEERAKTAAAWQRRARMYMDSAISSWWRGRTDGLNLPVHPKDGGTACLSNCACGWNIEEVDAAKGWFDCYWQLGDTEHCEDCVERAAQYSPYKVRPKSEKRQESRRGGRR